jgi:hypothetical protein
MPVDVLDPLGEAPARFEGNRPRVKRRLIAHLDNGLAEPHELVPKTTHREKVGALGLLKDRCGWMKRAVCCYGAEVRARREVEEVGAEFAESLEVKHFLAAA